VKRANFNTLIAFQDDGICGDVWANYIFSYVNNYNPRKVLVLIEKDDFDLVGSGDGLHYIKEFPFYGHKFVDVQVVPGKSIDSAIEIIESSDSDVVFWNISLTELDGATSEKMEILGALGKQQYFVYYACDSSMRHPDTYGRGVGIEPAKDREFYRSLNIRRHEGWALKKDNLLFELDFHLDKHFSRIGWFVYTEDEVSLIPPNFLFPWRLNSGIQDQKYLVIEQEKQQLKKLQDKADGVKQKYYIPRFYFLLLPLVFWWINTMFFS